MTTLTRKLRRNVKRGMHELAARQAARCSVPCSTRTKSATFAWSTRSISKRRSSVKLAPRRCISAMTKEQRKRPERSEVQRSRKGDDNFAAYALRVAKHHADATALRADRGAKKPKRR